MCGVLCVCIHIHICMYTYTSDGDDSHTPRATTTHTRACLTPHTASGAAPEPAAGAAAGKKDKGKEKKGAAAQAPSMGDAKRVSSCLCDRQIDAW